MKSKIRCIYIDGIERSGKTSITREMRRFLKEKEKDLHEIHGIESYADNLEKQNKILSDSKNSFVLKENSLMQIFYNCVKENNSGPATLEKEFGRLLRKEKELNHNFGVVHFFLIPEDDVSLNRIYSNPKEKPPYIKTVVDFYKSINLYTMTQGLDIRLIPFNEYDRIYDVRDKILKLLEREYEI